VTDSAQGIDVSGYNPPLTAAELKPYAFAFAKATDGPENMDPDFPGNWQVMKGAGIHRGAYHELWSASASSPEAQADRFLDVVTAAGLEPGDMLAVVASDYAGVTGAEVNAFCDQVKAAAPKSPVLAYSDLSMLPSLAECTGYDLWVAWPSSTAPASVAPWKTWRFWQWGETGTDRNAFNGTVAELQSWLDSVAYPAPPADWTYGAPRNLKVIGGHTSVRLTWEAPESAPEPPAEYFVYVYSGTACNRTTIVASYPRTVTGTSFEGGSLERGKHYTTHVVASGPAGTRVRAYCYASATFETG
jgi:GH25 family lysozyme M1 (1,4-beta-N-acetylmuramidase)